MILHPPHQSKRLSIKTVHKTNKKRTNNEKDATQQQLVEAFPNTIGDAVKMKHLIAVHTPGSCFITFCKPRVKYRKADHDNGTNAYRSQHQHITPVI